MSKPNSKSKQPAKPAAAAPEKDKWAFIPFGTFDKSKVVIEDPVTTSFDKNGGKVYNTTSKALYPDENGELGIPVFQLAPKGCFGVSPNHTYLKEKTEENIEGYQVCYPYTELSTVAKPTEEEQYGLDLMKALWDLTVEKGRVEATMDEPRVPAPTVNSFAGAEAQFKKNKLAFQNAVKLPYEHPNIKDSKQKDKTKPLRSYFKLVTQGKGADCRILTPFYEPGDNKVNGKKFIEKRGVIEPCVKWEGVRWGAHQNAPHGASLKFVITEANFVPGGNSKLPKKRMLPANTAEPVEEDSEEEVPSQRKGGKSQSSTEDDHTGEAEGFDAPDGEGDDADPMKELKASPATNGKKPPAKQSSTSTSTVGKPVLKKAGAGGKPGAPKPTAPSKTAGGKPTSGKAPAKTVTKPAAAGGGGKPKPEIKKKPAPQPVEEPEEAAAPTEEEVDGEAPEDENAQD